MCSNGLHQIIRQQTRITINSKTLIDLICVNNPHRLVQAEVLHTSLSDHALVLCVQKVGVPKSSPKYFEARSYKNYCKESFVRDFNQVPWSLIESSDDIDDSVYLWERLFCEVADDHAPVKKRRVKGFKSPWGNNELTRLRNARDYHHKKAIKTNLSLHWIRYKKLRNQVTRYEKKLKSSYYCNLINDSMSNSEEMWKSLK